MERTTELQNRNQKWYFDLSDKKRILGYFILLIVGCIGFSYIYYEIQCGVSQSHEELRAIMLAYMAKYKDSDNYQHWEMMLPLYYIAVSIWGLTYKALRMVFSIMFFGISIFTLDLCIRDQKKINIGNLPIYIILMVFLHLSGNYLSMYFGDSTFGSGYILTYPFSIHITPPFCSVFVIWCFKQIRTMNFYNKGSKLSKNIEEVLIIAFGLFLCGTTDWELYLTLIIFPYILLKMRSWISKRKVYITCSIIIVSLYIGLYFLVNNVLHDFLVNYPRLTNIKGIYELRNQISYFVLDLLLLYNIDITLNNLLLVDKIVFCFRGVLLLFILYIVLSTLKNYFKKDAILHDNDIIMAWAFCFLASSFIFTNMGHFDRVRYLNGLLPFGTILLCNNSEAFLQKLHIKTYSSLYIICGLVLVCSINKDWNVHVSDINIARVSNLIDSNGLHQGIGSADVANKVSFTSEGDNLVYSVTYDQKEDKFEYEVNADYSDDFIDYLLFYEDRTVYYSDVVSEDIAIQHFGKPDKIVKYDKYVIMIYKDGIDLKNEQRTDVEESEVSQHFYFNLNELGITENSKFEDDVITLESQGIQFGPYIDLEQGEYIVKYEGSGLEDVSIDCYSINTDKISYECEIQSISDDKLMYKVTIPEDASKVEFVLSDEGDENVIIKDLEVIKKSYQ